jgi:hypothetical protein
MPAERRRGFLLDQKTQAIAVNTFALLRKELKLYGATRPRLSGFSNNQIGPNFIRKLLSRCGAARAPHYAKRGTAHI